MPQSLEFIVEAGSSDRNQYDTYASPSPEQKLVTGNRLKETEWSLAMFVSLWFVI